MEGGRKGRESDVAHTMSEEGSDGDEKGKGVGGGGVE